MNYTHRDLVLEEVVKIINNNSFENVLEIGAGLNSFKDVFNVKEYTCIDNKSQYDDKKNISMDAHNLEFEDNTFDCVFMCHVAEHFLNPIKALKEIHRVLKHGGTLISITPFPCEHQILKGDPDHYFVLTPIQWIRLFYSLNYKELQSYIQMSYKNKQIAKEQNYNVVTVVKK